MRSICLNFAVAMAVVSVALLLVSALLETYAGVNLGTGTKFIPAMIAALYAGQRHAKVTGMQPTSRFSWIAALWMTLTGLIVSAVFLGVLEAMFSLSGETGILGAFSLINPGMIIAILVGTSFIQFLGNRYFFGRGAKHAIRAIDQKTRDTF